MANLAGGMAGWAMVYDAVTLELDDVRVVQVRRRGKGCLSYLVGAGDQAFVVDPSLDTEVYRRLADEHGWRIVRVFDTHLHADHLSGARLLAEETGAYIHLNPADTFDFAYEPLGDEDRFELPGGVSFRVAAIHTPGHTRGSTIYVVADRLVLSGDTLFVDSVGRPDLAERAEEFAHNLYHSLHEKVLSLPDDAFVLPGHYGDDVVVAAGPAGGSRSRRVATSAGSVVIRRGAVRVMGYGPCRATPTQLRRDHSGQHGAVRRAAPALRQLELGPNRCSVSA